MSFVDAVFHNQTKFTKKMHFSLLPNEIIIHILKYCSAKSLSNISRTNRRLREICDSEEIWKSLCLRDYGVKDKGKDFETFTELYKDFLHRYGHLIGTYMLSIPILGGLAEIVFQDCLLVWLWQQELNHSKPIKKLLLFKIIKGFKKSTANILCCTTNNTHLGCLKKVQRGRRFSLQCLSVCEHRNDKYIREIGSLSVERNALPDILLLEAIYLSALVDGLEFLPVRIPDRSEVPKYLLDKGKLPESVVEPGLFRSIYNYRSTHDVYSHVGFLVLDYKSDKKISLFNISQDAFENPERNAKILLYKAFVPSLGFEHEYFHCVLPMVPKGTYENIHPKYLQEQYFPVHIMGNDQCEVLKSGKCKARFCGFMPICHNEAEQVDLIVFDNDVIGVLWMKTGEFHIYERETKKFAEKRGHQIYVN